MNIRVIFDSFRNAHIYEAPIVLVLLLSEICSSKKLLRRYESKCTFIAFNSNSVAVDFSESL